MNKKLVCMFLCFALLTGLALPVCGQENDVLLIASVEEFLEFAENCRLDTYSLGLTVSLGADIDLSGTDFQGIPIFSGYFDGCGYTVSGFAITADGSDQGFFRYLTETATVQDLHIEAQLDPGGSRGTVGGIVGHNKGHILKCSFSGSVSGGDSVGGIAGVNAAGGIIESCRVEGEIHADHFVGGIAGENQGVIRSCVNMAQINITPQQNSIELSDITLDTLTNTEAANTVTDIGGIAGSSSGVIRQCENYGDVGYRHMGYNIGGIAGTQSGYIVLCKNHGDIQGRKEVGGIVGQMEPALLLNFDADTLQLLESQLEDLSGLADRTAGNAQSSAAQISGQIALLQEQIRTAREAAGALLPDAALPDITVPDMTLPEATVPDITLPETILPETILPETILPDTDSILAAQNTLTATLSEMPATLKSITAAAEASAAGLTSDLNAMSEQITKIEATLQNSDKTLGGSLTDVSDEDTADTLTGKIEHCINYGNVLADLNVGGITGAMAAENDLDVSDDYTQQGELSLNMEGQLRCVLLSCTNHGTVTGKKQNAGGIAGWQSFGLIKDCSNSGTVVGTDADYAGGICGYSQGWIRSCYAKCQVQAAAYVGGIAGSGSVVTDCRSQVLLSGKECMGAILGTVTQTTQEDVPVRDNYYVCVDADPGAVDGISYWGAAQPLPLGEFLFLEQLPDFFQTVTIRFIFEDGSIEQRPVTSGGSLDPDQIPLVPEKTGYIGSWEGLDPADLTDVLFDRIYSVLYTPCPTVISSAETGENGMPVCLVQGTFTGTGTVTVHSSDAAPVLSRQETRLGTWAIRITEAGNTVRLLQPAGEDSETLRLYVCSPDGEQDSQPLWTQVSYTRDGSYLVFSSDSTQMTVCVVSVQQVNIAVLWTVTALLLVGAGAVLVRQRKRKAVPADTAH